MMMMLSTCLLPSFVKFRSAVLEDKFRYINSIQWFQIEVASAPVNQSPGRPSWFSDRLEKNTNFVEEINSLLPVKFP